MQPQILLINGHPDSQSLCHGLAERYVEGAAGAGNAISRINLCDLQFDPVLHHGYRQRQEWEPDLVAAWQAIENADHLVFVYPNWWGAMPALMKGFFDRVFLPGKAFAYRENSILWDKLLKGKTAHLMVTMDTPPWYYRWVYRRPGHEEMKRTILEFCGVKVKRITEFAVVRGSDELQRRKWLDQAESLGRRGA